MKYVEKTFTYNGRRYHVYGNTEEEAIEKKILKLQQLKEGYSKPTDMTVNMWFEEYLTVYKANVLPTTLETYRSVYKNLIQPYIGLLSLSRVKESQCQKIMNSLSGKSKSSAHKAKILLQGMFSAAVRNKMIPYSPAEELIEPKVTEGKRRALTKDERIAVIKACDKLDESGLFCKIIYYCGLRPSEVFRIQEKDIDRVNHTLFVRGTKTRASERTVFIPEVFVIPKGFSFPPNTKTTIRTYWDQVKSQVKKNGDVIGEDLTMYCLRHDYCTRLQESGVPIDVARRLMGHSSVNVTSRIYTHESEVTLTNAAKLVNEASKMEKKTGKSV